MACVFIHAKLKFSSSVKLTRKIDACIQWNNNCVTLMRMRPKCHNQRNYHRSHYYDYYF